MQYIIVGDFGDHKECLIVACYSKQNAEQTLDRMLHNPTEIDKRRIAGHTNLRVKEVEDRYAWWRDPKWVK